MDPVDQAEGAARGPAALPRSGAQPALQPVSAGPPMLATSRWIGAAVVVVTTSVLVGWALDVEILTSVVPGLVSMKLNTALCLGSLGVALVVRRPGLVWSVAALALTVAGATLVQYLTPLDLGIDELVVDDPGDAGGNPPGRMAFATALSVCALALSLAAAALGRTRLARTLEVVPIALASLAILGYAYGVQPLFALAEASAMAVHTAVLVVALAVAADLALSGSVLRAALRDRGPAGPLLRTFGALALVVLPVLGHVRNRLAIDGVIGERFGTALMVIGGAGLLLTATLHSARVLSVTAAEEARAREALRTLNADLVEGRDRAWRRVEELADQLVRERQLFAQSISQFDDMVWTVRIDADDLDLVYASPNATGLFGVDVQAESDVLRAMGDLVHPEDQHLNHAFAASMLAGEAAESQFRVLGEDGAVRWLWARGAPRTSDGVRYYDGITSNVTERQRLSERVLELERDRVDQLERVQRMRDQFFATAGHELRTPLMVAGGYLELGLREAAPDGTQHRYLQVAYRGLEQASSLVTDLFDVARINAGIRQVSRVPLDLRALVSEAVEGHRQQAAAGGLGLHTDLGDVPDFAGDPRRLRQVLDNLLSNAVKYTPRGGAVTVTLDEIDEQARLRVADTGIGIPDDEVPFVFEHLFRSTTATTQGIEGTGLGLALTRALVEAHGGSIEVVPTEGAGAELEVRLPRRTPDQTDGTAETDAG